MKRCQRRLTNSLFSCYRKLIAGPLEGRRLPFVMAIICLAMTFAAAPAAAITVKIDYTYDTTGFFGGGNPQGPAAGSQARAALESAAEFLSGILGDSFSEISVPPQFNSSAFNGIASWQWSRNFSQPATGSNVTLLHATPGTTIAMDEYVVFAGARNLTTLAVGGPGGYSWAVDSNGGGFTSAEITQINSITDAFRNQVERRDETSGFARWGGSLAFDSLPSKPWHYDHTMAPIGNVVDFYTVSLHELAHALGFGTSNEWSQWVSGPVFTGPNAQASFGGNLVPLDDPAHWGSTLTSPVLRTATLQQTLMSLPAPITTRNFLTELDAAGLQDIGWTVVPEPTSGILTLVGLIAASALRRRP